MKTFEVEVIEVLNRVITVEANDESEALQKVEAQYNNSEIVLDSNDCAEGASFNVIGTLSE